MVNQNSKKRTLAVPVGAACADSPDLQIRNAGLARRLVCAEFGFIDLRGRPMPFPTAMQIDIISIRNVSLLLGRNN